MNKCPRCTREEIRLERTGEEAGQPIWRVYYCLGCSFTWRDSEPGASIDAAVRDRWFQIDPSDDDSFPYNIPPAR